MIRISKTASEAETSLEPFTIISESVLARRSELIRITAGCWSSNEADRFAADIRLLFDNVDNDDGAGTS